VAERPNALVLKTSVGKLTAGSNPAASANCFASVPLLILCGCNETQDTTCQQESAILQVRGPIPSAVGNKDKNRECNRDEAVDDQPAMRAKVTLRPGSPDDPAHCCENGIKSYPG
jgi:hypothetical protein